MMAILILSLLTSPLNSILMATVHSGQTLSVQSLFFALHPFISTSSLPFFPPSSLFCPSVVSLSDPCKINTWRLQRKDIWIVHMEYEIWTVFSLVIFSVSDGFEFSAAKGQRKKKLEIHISGVKILCRYNSGVYFKRLDSSSSEGSASLVHPRFSPIRSQQDTKTPNLIKSKYGNLGNF